jgi:hypothetical protein
VTEADLAQWRQANRVLFAKLLADGRIVGVTQMFFTGRVFVGDTLGYSDAWDYPETSRALFAAIVYEGEGDPLDGWVRHIKSWHPDRRRPDGTPASEYLDTGEMA